MNGWTVGWMDRKKEGREGGQKEKQRKYKKIRALIQVAQCPTKNSSIKRENEEEEIIRDNLRNFPRTEEHGFLDVKGLKCPAL